MSQPFLFCGRWNVQTDANGLVWMGSRYYHTGLKRFITQDVIVGGIDNHKSLNLYAYCQGDPIGMIDPLGTDPLDVLNGSISPEAAGAYAFADSIQWSIVGFANAFTLGFIWGDDLDRLRELDGLTSAQEWSIRHGEPAAGLVGLGVFNSGVKVVQTVRAGSKVKHTVDATAESMFTGHTRPWTKGATPNSIYTHINPKTGRAIQNAIYDEVGDVIGHVDFKNHGRGAPSGHGHKFPQPGNPASGHGAGKPHIPNTQLPPGWDTLPPGIKPHTPLGQ